MNEINCPSCGRPVSSSDQFCTNCGKAYPKESPKPVGTIPDEDSEPYRIQERAPAWSDRYRVLSIVSTILKVVAWVGSVGLLFAAIIGATLFSETVRVPGVAFAYLVGGGLGAVMWWLWNYAIAEFILLMIDLEGHARSVRLIMVQGGVLESARPLGGRSDA
jgi:predicted small integral membrane protein